MKTFSMIQKQPNPQAALLINSQNNRNVVIGAATAADPADLIVHGDADIKGVLKTKHFELKGDGTTNDVVLAANGVICSREMRVTREINIQNNVACSFPDYVFDASYPLMSLDTLAAYIKVNKHLPGIPTENEVMQNGIPMVKLQLKMLEKIEEQALYILELKKEIEALKSERYSK